MSGESDCEYSLVKKHNKNEFGDKNTKKRNEIFGSSPPNYQTDDHFRPVTNQDTQQSYRMSIIFEIRNGDFNIL